MNLTAMKRKAGVCGLLAVCWLALGPVNPAQAAAPDAPQAVDSDADGMDDSYELFYGLDPAANDARFDYDSDGLNNLQEAGLLTDPFEADTDRDGWVDAVDANPISRAFIPWGTPRFTSEDVVDYAHPSWFLLSYKTGGEWGRIPSLSPTNGAATDAGERYAWRGVAGSNETVSLNVDLDRGVLTNNLVYAVRYWGGPRSALYADLLDAHGAVVAEDLYGNLLDGTDEEAVLLLDVPTAAFSNAAVIHLRCTAGEVVVVNGLVYIDEDGDWLDSDQERRLGTSDYNVDSNSNGVPDYAEAFGYATNNAVLPVEPRQPKPPEEDAIASRGVIYVDQVRGSDSHTGRAAVRTGKDGPKKTAGKGMEAVAKDRAHTLVINAGTYNENLNLGGKKVKLVIVGKVKL